MQGYGGFDHQRQTMRIVQQLERRYPEFPGINLSYEVREGLVKHDTDYDVINAEGYQPELSGTLECQIANLSDEIAWNTSDLDDGFYAGILNITDLAEQPLWQRVMDSLDESYTPAKLDPMLRSRIIRRLVGIEVSDAVEHTLAQLRSMTSVVDDLRAVGHNLAGFSPALIEANAVQKSYLFAHFTAAIG